MAADLRLVYSATTIDAAEQVLSTLVNNKWNNAYPSIVLSWRNSWQCIISFFGYPSEIRRIIHTTNAIGYFFLCKYFFYFVIERRICSMAFSMCRVAVSG